MPVRRTSVNPSPPKARKSRLGCVGWNHSDLADGGRRQGKVMGNSAPPSGKTPVSSLHGSSPGIEGDGAVILIRTVPSDLGQGSGPHSSGPSRGSINVVGCESRELAPLAGTFIKVQVHRSPCANRGEPARTTERIVNPFHEMEHSPPEGVSRRRAPTAAQRLRCPAGGQFGHGDGGGEAGRLSMAAPPGPTERGRVYKTQINLLPQQTARPTPAGAVTGRVLPGDKGMPRR